MAFFGKTFGGGDSAGPQYSPEKAAKFFEHARTAHETQNFEYAIQNWCNGLRQDPRAKSGLNGLWESVQKFNETPAGKKGLSKETVRSISGKSDADRFVTALLEWIFSPADASLALHAAETGGKSGAQEVGGFVAEQALKILRNMGPKAKKDHFLRLSEAFTKLGMHDRSLNCAEEALKLDPSDGELAAKIRSLAAAATMMKGGYEQAGQEGGFQKMIRDAAKQKELIDNESIVKTGETMDRVVALAEADYNARPTDQFAIGKYADKLMERGRPEDERKALDILMKGFADTKQSRFRIRAGEIKIRQNNRRLVDLRKMLESSPDDPDVRAVFEHESRVLVEQEVEEYKLRVEAYPTDVGPKYELARLSFALEKYDDAIALLQEIKTDPKFKARVLSLLGQCFSAIDFRAEAVQIFREAVEVREVTSDQQLEIRYNLMFALRKLAEANGDLAAADESMKIASSIAIQQINYKDIRKQREELGKLVQQLKNK